jgi:hypothetical protein
MRQASVPPEFIAPAYQPVTFGAQNISAVDLAEHGNTSYSKSRRRLARTLQASGSRQGELNPHQLFWVGSTSSLHSDAVIESLQAGSVGMPACAASQGQVLA